MLVDDLATLGIENQSHSIPFPALEGLVIPYHSL